MTARPRPALPLWTGAGTRWGLDTGSGQVHFFTSERARKAWIEANPHHRQAVGKRNPHVKAYRRAVSGRTNI